MLLFNLGYGDAIELPLSEAQRLITKACSAMMIEKERQSAAMWTGWSWCVRRQDVGSLQV